MGKDEWGEGQMAVAMRSGRSVAEGLQSGGERASLNGVGPSRGGRWASITGTLRGGRAVRADLMTAAILAHGPWTWYNRRRAAAEGSPPMLSTYPSRLVTGMISVTGFSKSYGETPAVEDLSFDVAAGSILGMLGPNGAGKTTTLRTMAGILQPTAGRLSIGGHDIVEDPVGAKQRLALVPDDPRLFDSLTVWEHLEFIAAAYRVPDFSAAAESLLERFELTDQRNTAARELSRGMRQKAAICCAYLHGPSAILLDEPMTGLDPRGIRTLKDSVREQAGGGAAVVISSHLLSLIEDLCTDLLILHRGRRLFCGTTGEARTRYRDLEGESSLEAVFFKATQS